MSTPIILVVAIGLVCAVVLTVASKVFYVPVDETVAKLNEELPGANCGGCGYAGCEDYAKALAADHSLDCTKCAVGGAEVAAKIAEILGVSAGDSEPNVAVVMCNGQKDAAKPFMDYKGLQTCAAAKTFYSGVNQCKYGCIGLGDCTRACNFDAIRVINGVAIVDRTNCVGCGACATACPNGIIQLTPESSMVMVRCSNHDKGAAAMKACKNACIGCGKCERTCKFDAIHVEDNVAHIDPEKCKNCGMCEKECPTGAIANIRPWVREQQAAAKAKAEAGEA